MNKFFTAILSISLLCVGADAKKIKFDYSVVNVPEEGGVNFERITDDADCVLYTVNNRSGVFGRKKASAVDWWVNPQIAISPDGQKIAYINLKNGTSNIMVKSAKKGGASVQRTFRSAVEDFTWSSDGKTLCFTEVRNGHHGIYLVNADQGSVVKQISGGTDNDYGGVLSRDGNTIFFHRGEGLSSYSIWSYDRKTNLFSNYSRGMTPVMIPGKDNEIYCARFTDQKESEIWRINFETGVEEIILSLPGRSFTTPQLSPDGNWLLVTGTSISEKDKSMNTDIFVVRTDGTNLTQLTYHPGNDMSGIWSPDGKYIYFLSQRGSAKRIFNVWKMSFDL
ncbi:hypothetical protein [uncultured Muribaculum sp.]|uniref:hypothetical protein n=1 Tax=uncultured Muribaculum sp. TaxID=1918613 RepID=UPI0025E3C0A7|nr:hypothetical protein [uncultured Muribaculum sp.]